MSAPGTDRAAEAADSAAPPPPASAESVTVTESGAIDPEDWASSDTRGEDERYRNERPPHWE